MSRTLAGGALLLVACGGGEPPPASTTSARVVVLAPSATETVFALGAGDRVVGVCGQCDFPPAATQVAKVGGYLAPSVESIVGVRPDLVVAVPSPGNREVVRAVERVGIRVVVVQDRTLDDLWDSIRILGAALEVPDAAARLAADVHTRLDAVAASVAGRPRARVLLVVGHHPLIVAGGGTLQSELVEIAGGANVAADIGATWPQISVETVVARAPDVIVDAAMGTEEGTHALFEGLTTIPAVAHGRLVPLRSDALFRAGPRVAEAAALLAAAIHGDRPA